MHSRNQSGTRTKPNVDFSTRLWSIKQTFFESQLEISVVVQTLILVWLWVELGLGWDKGTKSFRSNLGPIQWSEIQRSKYGMKPRHARFCRWPTKRTRFLSLGNLSLLLRPQWPRSHRAESRRNINFDQAQKQFFLLSDSLNKELSLFSLKF